MTAPFSAGKKKVLFLLLTSLFGISLGLVSAEILLRSAGPAWLHSRMRRTNLEGDLRYGSDSGWPVESLNGKFLRFKPQTNFQVRYYEYNTVAHTDPYGGRIVQSNAPEASPILPFFGDSFTFGLGVNDDETFASLIAERSAAHILNLGVPGSSLPNHLDILEARYKQLRSPRYCIFVLYVGNDFTDMIKYHYATHKTPERNVPKHTAESMLARSYLYQLIALSDLDRLEDQNSARHNHGRFFWTPDRKRVSNSVYLLMSGSANYQREAGRIFDHTLERLVKLSDQLHFLPFFIILPDKHQTDPELFAKHAKTISLDPAKLQRELPNNFVEQHLNLKNISSLNLYSCFANVRGMYYEIDDHLTKAGHKKAAECILQDERLNPILRASETHLVSR